MSINFLERLSKSTPPTAISPLPDKVFGIVHQEIARAILPKLQQSASVKQLDRQADICLWLFQRLSYPYKFFQVRFVFPELFKRSLPLGLSLLTFGDIFRLYGPRSGAISA
ncbi:MAG: hypothetical protein R6U13_07020 [Desulfatiglandaceae bacterium]